MNRMRVWLSCVLCATVMLTTQAVGQIDRGAEGPSRWAEHAYGMSLSAPLGATWIEQTNDGARVKFLTPGSSTISIYIRQANAELNLPAVKVKAIREFGFIYPSVVTLAQDSEPVTIAGREGLGLFLLVPDDKRGDWVFAQIYTLVDPKTLAIYQLDCDAKDFDFALKTFQTMLNGVGFADPAELDRERAKRINNARVWLESIEREEIKNALIDEQWLRITQGGKDVGHMRIRHHDEAEYVVPGTSVEVRSHIIEGQGTYDTEARFFESDDRQIESWSITTTLRIPQNTMSPSNRPLQPSTQTWHQEGIRNGKEIQVSQESPTNIKEHSWDVPPFSYVSQVNMYILPALLPRDEPTELAFYSIHQNSRKLSLRTLRIEPLPGGSYRVLDRPTPDRTEQVATYSPTGRLIERRMSDGRVYLATTPQELKRIWGSL